MDEITRNYLSLKIAVVGDICLDRYFEIDPSIQEISIETNLPVHNITRVRCQPGGAGTILNNLVALGVGTIYPISIIGQDGEGYELHRALDKMPGLNLQYLVESAERRTFSYTKPLVIKPGKPPVELNRLDIKNRTPTPEVFQDQIYAAVLQVARTVDAIIVLDQVDIPETGVVTRKVLEAIDAVSQNRPEMLILADSRRGLRGYPPVGMKMNAAELAAFTGHPVSSNPSEVQNSAADLSARSGKHVFVTLSENGIVGAKGTEVHHVPALLTRGPIDIVGAGDAVTANLTTALAAGATLPETLQLASLAGSVVIHQLGTTGTATPEQLGELLVASPFENV